MPVFELRESIAFPAPHLADETGLLAIGGDLQPERLLLAYELGIFPWYNDDQPLLWWSPPERMLLFPGELKVSKSLQKRVDRQAFEVRIDTSFAQVMHHCAHAKRKGQDGTWITNEMTEGYCALHEMGYAHSFEAWQDGQLVGGLYGLSLGRAFFGESMFSLVTDASKVAFYHLHAFAQCHAFHFIDCQLHTDHLESLGARQVPREAYIKALNAALAFPDFTDIWHRAATE